MKNLFSVAVLCVSVSTSWAQTYLSPNQLGSGKLPGSYTSLVFSLGDGNWTSQISLPATGSDSAAILIRSNATWSSQVMQANTDVPVAALTLATGQSLSYRYSALSKRWQVQAPTVSPVNAGSTFNMLSTTDRVQRLRLLDTAWAQNVNLPATAVDGAVVLAQSSASRPSRIVPDNVLHASTMPLRAGDDYAFVFHARLGKWVLNRAPETLLSAASLSRGPTVQMDAPATALTRVSVGTGSAVRTLVLPASAGDRDRVIVQSSVPERFMVSNTNVQETGTMTVGQGQSCEFMWDAKASKWVAQNMPRTQFSLGAIKSAMPPTLTPVTEVLAWDGNWNSMLKLPAQAAAGDRVVVRSSATWGFTVVDPATGGVALKVPVSQGEEVVFVRSASGWARETDTVRILLSFGQGVSTKLGASAARARQVESLRLTNEALENSGARFRFQLAGLLEVPDLGSTLGDAVDRARSNAAIQNERKRVLADAVYYEGIESGCGLAWVNSSPLAYNMVATGSTSCGTTVMRHELGHNMGLSHGNGVIATVMSGNAVPAYATPKRFDAALRVPLGQGATVPDEVMLMDKNAPAVARFR